MDFDTSILDRVKKRLQNNKPDAFEDAAGDTQVIPDFGTSILFGTQAVSEKPSGKLITDDVPRAIRLPQLALDEADFYSPTQVIGNETSPKESDIGSTQVIPRSPEISLFVDDTQKLTDADNNKRVNHNQLLAAELTRASLTDEENDLNDQADTTLDSSVQKTVTTKAELRQIEQDLSEQKRLRNIQPEFQKKAINPMQKLLDAFESDSDEEAAINSEAQVSSSPSTSPIIKKADEGQEASFNFDLEEDNIMDLFNERQKPVQKKKLSPIEEYAEKLKKQLNSSPTGSQNEEIDLDDSDTDTDFEKSEKSEIPKLTKEQAFIIKSKFSKKLLKGKNSANAPRFHTEATLKQSNNLFNELRRANARQIIDMKRNNPDSELIEEIEKEEEEMGNLLEREMERVRRIRKREKLHEKAQKALLADKSDEDYDSSMQDFDNGDIDEVPESDLDSVDYDEDRSGFESEEDIAVNQEKRGPRARRAIVSDDEDDDNVSSQEQIFKPEIINRAKENRTDDSYMFGGPNKESDSEGNDEPIMHIYSDMARPESPISDVIKQNLNNHRDDSHVLFSNLPPPDASQESTILEAPEAPGPDPGSFIESSSTQKSLDDPMLLETQVDGPSINGASTQSDQFVPTQMDSISDDEGDDVRLALDSGRRQIRENLQQATRDKSLVADDIDEDDEQDKQDEQDKKEALKEKIALYEARIRKKELRARKLRKDMERRGMKGIVEGEAEESDDEWKGIGGVDREESDQANSEDERMIDNSFNIDLNDEDVRNKFMEQYQIKDRRELEKLMDDIKNHRLTKRARANGFDIELSDEEDEILMAYRRQKLEEQKQRLLENQKMMQSAKSEKSKAFFECIQEGPSAPILVESELSDASSVEEIEDTPLVETEVKPKKKKVLEESFVQKQLSFLSKTNEDEYMAIQRTADAQHAVDTDLDDMEDISLLKKRCLSSLYSRPGSAENISGAGPPEEIATDEDEEDFSRVFKKPSMVSSFRSFREKNAAQISNTSFSGVTVNKQYKTASASKSSITYMSKQSKSKQAPTLSFKSSKIIEIEARVNRVKLESEALRSRDRFA